MGRTANSSRKLTADQIAMIRSLRAEGHIYKDIAEKVGVSQSAAKKYARDVERAEDSKARLTPDLIQRAREMRKDGHSLMSICAELGIDLKTAKRHTEDIEYQPSKGLREEDIQKIRDLRKQGYSISYIAILTRHSQGTVVKYTRGIVVGREIKPKPPKKEPQKTGGLCRHKSSCIYWRPVIGFDCFGCHYPFERGELRPWPADQCPGFPEEGGQNEIRKSF